MQSLYFFEVLSWDFTLFFLQAPSRRWSWACFSPTRSELCPSFGVHSSHPRQLLHGLRVRGAQQDREAAHQVQQSGQHGSGVREGGQHLEGACPWVLGPPTFHASIKIKHPSPIHGGTGLLVLALPPLISLPELFFFPGLENKELTLDFFVFFFPSPLCAPLGMFQLQVQCCTPLLSHVSPVHCLGGENVVFASCLPPVYPGWMGGLHLPPCLAFHIGSPGNPGAKGGRGEPESNLTVSPPPGHEFVALPSCPLPIPCASALGVLQGEVKMFCHLI